MLNTVVHPVRKIALALIPKLDKELDSMLADGIIVPVEESTDWVNSLVVREKPNGSLRVCVDPRDLNKAIRREHYPVPTVESVTAKLHGSTLFSRLGAKSAYWNVELDEELSYVTTFNTHRGRFRYKRMFYGLNISHNIFQKRMDQSFEICNGAIIIADGIQEFGTDDSHDMHLHETMERVRCAGIKLHFEKCVIKSKSCTLFGNVYTTQRVKPDPKKVEAIKKMKTPRQSRSYNPFLVW